MAPHLTDDRHGGCGRRWVQADYDRLVLILVTEAKEQGWAIASSQERVTT